MKSQFRFLYLLALVKLALPFFLQNGVYEPHRDEFLYLAEGIHPAFGYMEIPPLLSVFAWLTQHLGNNMFWIKFWPSLFGAFNLILVGRIVILEGGRFYALFLLFCCFFFSAYIRVHFLFQPNFLEIFFYSVIAFGLIRFIRTKGNQWLYVTGLGVGFGLLSKYSVAFYLVSLIPALLLTRQRSIFLNKHFYYAMGLAFLIFLPNLIWQYVNHFPVIYHMHELTTTQLQYVPPAEFLTDQLLMFMPCFFIWVTGLLYLFLNPKMRDYIFLGWAYLGVVAILLWFHGKGYYALGLYPMLLGFGTLAIERWAVRVRYFLRYIIASFVILPGIYFTFIGLPLMPPAALANFYHRTHAEGKGILRWEDQQDHRLPQDFADMLGWKEMAEKTALAFHRLDSNQQAHCIIFCDNYGLAGAVDYYGNNLGLPEAYSDNASFLYWISDSLHFQNIVLVTGDQDEMQHPFIRDFEHATVIGQVTDSFAREKGTQIILLEGANDVFRQFFQEKLKADRQKTRGF